MASSIDQIKDRLDIVELIQGYVRLQKAGINFKALCPFHNEKTPSFFVSPERQLWKCFGCGNGGDHFKFLMQIEGLEFPEALRVLAKRAGVELGDYDRETASERTKLYEISELAAKFFEKQLWEAENGKKALEYLKNRGLKEETIKEWRLGYAPNTWNSLKRFLKDAGYSGEEIEKAGLVVKKEIAGPDDYESYDRFRGRIMFPVFDIQGQVVGFSARIFEQVTGEVEAGKYINTPQTSLYDKSRLLYGLDKSKMEIRKNDRAILVEGNLDVIMSHQAGVKNVVASSGTALTHQHLKIIRRYTENLDLCFDQDSAGEIAAKRGIQLALARGFNVGVITLPAKDPADLVKEAPEKWVEVSVKNQPVIKFYIDNAFAKHDTATALGKKNIAREVLPVIKLVENRVEQAHWLDEFSQKLKVGVQVLAQTMTAIKIRPFQETEEEGEADLGVSFESPSRLMLEEALLALLLKLPEKAKEIKLEQEEFEIFREKLYKEIFEGLEKGQTAGFEPLNYEDKLRVELIRFKEEQLFNELQQKDLEAEILRLTRSLKKECILDKLRELEGKIKEIEAGRVPSSPQVNKKAELLTLLQEVQKFSSKLASL